MVTQLPETLTFDDVLLVPQKSAILPKDVILSTWLTTEIELNLPFLSAPMDTVTEHETAIALALAGGIGIIHRNLTIAEQVAEVQKVKRFENGFIENPLTVTAEDTIEKVSKIKEELGYKNIPVVDNRGKLVGFISEVDYWVPDDNQLPVKARMRPLSELFVAKQGITLDKANEMIRKHRLNTLCVVNSQGKLVHIVTRSDLKKNILYPAASKNEAKQLRVGAAIGAGQAAIERAEALIAAKTDVIVIDTAHGHSEGVLKTLKTLKQMFRKQQIIAGNIATKEAARELIAAGADAIKVGIGPGSICTTRIVSGIGVPQLSAIQAVVAGVKASKRKVPVIADGGIKNSGDITKALAAGASSVMMGNMFAGTDEAPGKIEFSNGKMLKVYRGMGSLEAMDRGSKDRYGQGDIREKTKYVPEGVSGRVLYKGAIDRILYQLAGGIRSGMGYCGSKTIPELQKKATFVKISHASMQESHPHTLGSMESAPNYTSGLE